MNVEVLVRGPIGLDKLTVEDVLRRDTDPRNPRIAQLATVIDKLTDAGHVTGLVLTLDVPVDSADERVKWMQVGLGLSDLECELNGLGYGHDFSIVFLDEVVDVDEPRPRVRSRRR